MTDPTSSTPDYTMGFGETITQFLMRFTAETRAVHLLPYLKPGLRVLDFGCGPGTISVGLAKAVEPGEVHGIDMEEAQIDIARSVAKAGGHDNAIFHVGDVTALPFEDDFFDVAHGHAILTHVPDTQAVLGEVKRVLKPGGIVSSREAIFDCSFIAPGFEVIGSAWDTFSELLTADDGHPNMGQDMKRFFLEAGFTNIRPSASFDVYSTAEDLAFFYGVLNNWFLSPEVVAAATQYGVATQRQFDNLRRAFDRWMSHPGAIGGIAHGEIIACKP